MCLAISHPFRFGLTILSLFLAGISAIQADIVTLVSTPDLTTGGNVNALAGPLGSSSIDSIDIAGPGVGTATTTLGGNTATHEYAVELDYSGGFAFFDSSYGGAFERTSTLDHRASAESIFQFAVDSPAAYESMGFFDVIDEDGTTVPGNVELEIELLEFESFAPTAPPPTVLFYSYQVSKSMIDEKFDVGGTEGDTVSILEGSAVGMLDPSKFYRYRTLVTINAIDIDGSSGPLGPTDGTASADGAHVLLISAAGIPEPSSAALLLALGSIMVPFARRRRKN